MRCTNCNVEIYQNSGDVWLHENTKKHGCLNTTSKATPNLKQEEVKEALLFLYNHRKIGEKPSWLDYANALNYPIEDIISVYNELVDERIFSGEKACLQKSNNINTDAKAVGYEPDTV